MFYAQIIGNCRRPGYGIFRQFQVSYRIFINFINYIRIAVAGSFSPLMGGRGILMKRARQNPDALGNMQRIQNVKGAYSLEILPGLSKPKERLFLRTFPTFVRNP